MKVVFLDIDGVLNTGRSGLANGPAWDDAGWNNLDATAIGLLQELQRVTGCEFILSSTWRLNMSVERLSLFGNFLGLKLVGATPSLSGGGRSRGHEIEASLKEHPSVESYIIIDDYNNMFESQQDRLILVDPDEGFGFADFHKAVSLLGLQSPAEIPERECGLEATSFDQMVVEEANRYIDDVIGWNADESSEEERSILFNVFLKGAHTARLARSYNMPDHRISQIVNVIRDIAKVYGDSQSLRERIAQILVPVLQGKSPE